MDTISAGSSDPDRTAGQPVYIIDEPASEDRFGAHSAIAHAIISTLETQEHIRLIGLLGRWGTGKSTIVAQLANQIKTNYRDKYVLFAYDAWAHQGDPIRRSILEELIARLVGLRLTKEGKWHETLLEISGSTESSSTKTTTKLSGWGKLLVALLLVIPIFAAIIDAETIRKTFTDYSDYISLWIVRGFLIYLSAIVLVILLAYVSSLNYAALVDQQATIPNRLRSFVASREDLLSVMLTRQFPGTSSTTLRKSQPTAIEFRRYLRRIIENQRPKRLIFVIDNLDRIDPSEALEVWSIMVGMVADEAHRMNAAIEPIVILPFDPVALEKIVPVGRLEGYSASDLIEKSFDVTYEVPPPVLSNWRAYFVDQYERCGLWKETGESSVERYWTIRNFEQCLGKERVTPRKINRFLNRVISLSQQQVETIGPTILSYYIAHEAGIQTDCLAFLKSHRPAFDDSNAWQRKLAAVAFGTTEAEAAEILLGDELLEILRTRNAEGFRDIVDFGGFVEVARNLVENPPRTSSGAIDAPALSALAVFYANTPTETADKILWSRLWQSWREAPSEGGDAFVAAAISGFLTAVPEEVERHTSLIASKLIEQIGFARDPAYAEELTQVGDRVIERAPPGFTVDLGEDTTLLLKAIANSSGEGRFEKALRCDCEFGALAELILEKLNGSLAPAAPADFRLVDMRIEAPQVHGDKNEFYEAVGAGLKEILLNVESADASIVAAAQILAAKNSGQLRYLPIISELVNSGTLSEVLQRALENNAHAVISAVSALLLTAASWPAPEELNQLAAWLKDNDNVGRLLASFRQFNAGSFLPALRSLEIAGHDVTPILKPLLLRAIRNNNIGALAHTDWLLKNFKNVVPWLSAAEASRYAKLLTERTSFSAEIQKLPDDDFLALISRLDAKAAKPLLSERIRSFNEDRLASFIFAGDSIFQSYIRQNADIGQNLTGKSPLFKALHAVLSGSKGPLSSRVAQRALKFVPLLNSDTRKQLIRSVVGSAMEAENAEALVFLAGVDGFDSYLSRPSVASKVISSLFTKLRRTRDGQKFVERHVGSFDQISEPARTSIREILDKAGKSRDKRTADWARYVFEKSGLKR